MKKKLSREEARELYDDLKKAMDKMMGPGAPKMAESSGPVNSKVAKEIAKALSDGLKGSPMPREVKGAKAYERQSQAAAQPMRSSTAPRYGSRNTPSIKAPQSNQMLFMTALLALGAAKVAISVLEATGAADVPVAQAAVVAMPEAFPVQKWSKEEVQVLTSLDNRRAELEARRERLDTAEQELQGRDREIVARLAELRELTEKLKTDRDKNSKQRSAQMEQLSNVYGSMNPEDAAHLLEQLDVTVALSLIERMPEKRIGQILQLMSAEKALMMTKLLSSRAR